MKKTIFNISKMDCHAEKQMIRIHLEGLVNVHTLCFDIPGRRLAVLYHEGDCGNILEALNNLQLDTRFVLSEAVDVIDTEKIDGQGKLVLWQVLIINFFFFALEILAGFIANSMGLIADSLDMLADSIVYGLSLFAVGGTKRWSSSFRQPPAVFKWFAAQVHIASFAFGSVLQ